MRRDSGSLEAEGLVPINLHLKVGQMNALDLTKATVVCGSVAYLVYSFPVISQGFIIGLLTVMWLSYAYRLAKRLLAR